MCIRLADNQCKMGNSYTRQDSENLLLLLAASVAGTTVCVKMMVLKIRLETDEWVYEEHESA